MNPECYNSPFIERWCRGSPLNKLFSEQNKAEIWRLLWIWLAESQRELGLDSRITLPMITEMKEQRGNFDWKMIRGKEKELKHDVMAHIHAFGQVCPKSVGIIHLGVTSCFVQDNADLKIQQQALEHILAKLAICLDRLGTISLKYAAQPTVGRTHFQTASLTTTGKRAAIWADGLLDSFELLKNVLSEIRFRGVKGSVGTQDALMELFKGDSAKVQQLDQLLTKKAGFERAFDICGQTYPRYQDSHIIFALSSLGSVAHKIALDIRLLQAIGELAEPFDVDQIGSSAMPYKRNPMRSERICGIARYLMNLVLEPLNTFANQGFERTLDDSSNRRIVLPDAFLAADAILDILQNIFEGLNVNVDCIDQNVQQFMPSAVLERAMMILVERGEDRQKVHSKIREIALGEGSKNAEMIANSLKEIRDELLEMIANPIRLCGRAEEQTREFVERRLKPTIADIICKVQNAAEKKYLDV